jgi:hypothetical protein
LYESTLVVRRRFLEDVSEAALKKRITSVTYPV